VHAFAAKIDKWGSLADSALAASALARRRDTGQGVQGAFGGEHSNWLSSRSASSFVL